MTQVGLLPQCMLKVTGQVNTKLGLEPKFWIFLLVFFVPDSWFPSMFHESSGSQGDLGLSVEIEKEAKLIGLWALL